MKASPLALSLCLGAGVFTLYLLQSNSTFSEKRQRRVHDVGKIMPNYHLGCKLRLSKSLCQMKFRKSEFARYFVDLWRVN